MKKIENFITFEILDISKVNGGLSNTPSSKSKVISSGECCQLVTTTDVFTDCNGNGQWDSDENGSSVSTCQEIDCP